MTTMKIKIKKEINEELEIALPYFCKIGDNAFFYKIFSEEKCLQICTIKESQDIGIKHAGLPFSLSSKPSEITADEFHEVFNETLTILAIK